MSTKSPRPIRILHLEDNDADSDLVRLELQRGVPRAEIHRARTGPEFMAALREVEPDILLSDSGVHGFDGLTALMAAREMRPDLPVIFVSGTMGEERAVDAMKLGAADYVLKSQLERLSPVVSRALRESEQRRRRQAADHTVAEMRDRMEFALEAAQVGIWEWDIAAGTVTWSGLTEQMHGFEPGSFPGTLAAALAAVHPDDRQKLLETLDRLEPANSRFQIEYRVDQPNAEPRWLETVGQIYHDDVGRAIRASGISHDITVQRSLEDQLLQVQRLDSIGRVAAGIAHDFNNLLGVIRGYTEMLLERFKEVPAAVNDLAEVQRAAQSATALTGQLLAFSRRQVLSPKVVNLNDVVLETQKMMRRVIEENVELTIGCAPEPLPVKVDVNQIEQVLLNLVVNARDAMPEGGIITIGTDEVVVSSRAPVRHIAGDIPDGRYARLTVADTGTGIPSEVQSRIFEPFFTTKEQGRGTGLGLATVYGIVAQSGGQVSFESNVGVGTIFEVWLPRLERAEDQERVEPRDPRALHGRRILVVEDQPALQILIGKMLALAHCEVVTVSSAEEARQVLSDESKAIDLVLTDVVMRGDSGYSLAKWIAEERPGLPVIFMTGHVEGTRASTTATDEGITLLQKPFSRETLMDAIDRALSR